MEVTLDDGILLCTKILEASDSRKGQKFQVKKLKEIMEQCITLHLMKNTLVI